MPRLTEDRGYLTSVVIGGLPIDIQSASRDFIAMLEKRYAGFVAEPANAGIRLDVEVVASVGDSADEDLEVRYADGRWMINRGDFRAQWDPASQSRMRPPGGTIRTRSTLSCASCTAWCWRSGEASWCIRPARCATARAFLFSGVSGAGKTTISRLAPPDVTLLTDEISYVRRVGDGYEAFGTPFAGELGKAGENISAPIAGLYLLAQGRQNHARRIGPGEAARRLLRNILFFADDASLVEQLFRYGLRVRLAGSGLRIDLSAGCGCLEPDRMSEEIYQAQPGHRGANDGGRNGHHDGQGLAGVQP